MDDEHEAEQEPSTVKQDAGTQGQEDAMARSVDAAEIHFKCPCGAELNAPEDKASSQIACSRCGRLLVVPRIAVPAGIGRGDEIELPTAQEAPSGEEFEMREEIRSSMSGMAVASLVLGLVGPFLGLLALVAGVLALIFGGVALRSIKRSPFLRGKGTAIAGIVLGVIDILLGVTFLLAIYGSQKPEDSLNVVLSVASIIRLLHLF